MFKYKDGTLVPEHEQKDLKPQAQECQDDPRIKPEQRCHRCALNVRRAAANEAIPEEDACGFKGFRATKVDGEEDYVQQAFWEDILVENGAWPENLEKEGGLGGFPTPLETSKHSRAFAAFEIATGIRGLLAQELKHASGTPHPALTRKETGDYDSWCDCCRSFLLGSWTCARCGKDLCLNCFDNLKVRAQLDTMVDNYKMARACQAGHGPKSWQPHQPRDFFPVARISAPRLAHDLGMTVWVESIYQDDASKFVDLYKLGTAYEIRRALLADLMPGIKTVTTKRKDLKKSHPVAVMTLSQNDAPTTRARRVMEATLVSSEAFVIQQDVRGPMTDDEFRQCLPEHLFVPLKVQRHGDAGNTVVEQWTWKQIVDELTGVQDTVTFLDIRDFPKDNLLINLGPRAAERFAQATLCPGAVTMQPKEGDTEELRKQKMLNLVGDIGSWIAHARRDAQEKFYLALEAYDQEKGDTTSLHVDEAGAVNIAIWTPGEDKEEGSVKAPAYVAEWLVWPSTARAYMQEAAENVTRAGKAEGTGVWDGGHAVWGQKYTANNVFIEEVVRLGGESCRARVIHQKVGDAVVIMPGCPHQVRNVRTALKIAKDFTPPSYVEEVLQIQKERASASNGTDDGRDACMIRPTLYHGWRKVLSRTIQEKRASSERTTAMIVAALPYLLATQTEKIEAAVATERSRIDAVEARVSALERDQRALGPDDVIPIVVRALRSGLSTDEDDEMDIM